MLPTWNDLLNLIFPHKPECPFCEKPGPGGVICLQCQAVFEGYRREPHCVRCGRLPGKDGRILFNTAHLCYECRKREWPFALSRAAGPYEGILKQSMRRFKYAGRRSLAVPLGGLMARTCLEEPILRTAHLILPVPLSGEKLRLRGFNQAALLAKELGRLLKIPVDVRSLVKMIDTPPQAGLSRSARESNLVNAFIMTNSKAVKGRNLLLIDDVFTTGSTMSAAAAALKRSGSEKVFGLTAAAVRYF